MDSTEDLDPAAECTVGSTARLARWVDNMVRSVADYKEGSKDLVPGEEDVGDSSHRLDEGVEDEPHHPVLDEDDCCRLVE